MPANASLILIFFWSFAATFGAVISPGPVSTTIVSQAPRRGWLVGPLVAIGHSLLELVIVALIVFGLGTLLAAPSLRTAIALLGGLLLLVMGVLFLVDVWKGKVRLPSVQESQPSLSYGKMMGLGVVATLSNPFWYAYWATVVPAFIAPLQTSLLAVTAFYLGHISADIAWDTFLSTAAAAGRRWMTDRIYQGLMVVCALVLLVFGVQFILQGLG